MRAQYINEEKRIQNCCHFVIQWESFNDYRRVGEKKRRREKAYECSLIILFKCAFSTPNNPKKFIYKQ